MPKVIYEGSDNGERTYTVKCSLDEWADVAVGMSLAAEGLNKRIRAIEDRWADRPDAMSDEDRHYIDVLQRNVKKYHELSEVMSFPEEPTDGL